ncbi:MAG: glycosyltransferase family 4 protein [Parcubacteria group bacterium]|jgi:phosphatidylinositol alpha-1,6-mannosyltransferase
MSTLSDKDLRILFISRAYPPVFGGIENQNYGIAHALKDITPTTILANTKGKKFLPFFLPYALCKMLFLLPRHDAVLFGDGVLSPLGRIAHIFYPHKKFISIVHGLDITYAQKNSLLGKVYRTVNIPALRHMDKLIAVGTHTITEAVRFEIDRDRCTFIPNGIDPQEYFFTHTREELAQLLHTDLTDKKVILRMGRFVPHKGVAWFLDQVMPFLPRDIIFVAMGGAVSNTTAGDDNVLPLAQKMVEKHNLHDRVFLLPNRPDAEKIILFNTVDLVISPNIDIPGSMEGFGINAVETATCERVVIASNFQGLKDAVHDGKNGFLIEHENAQMWIKKIIEVLSDDFDRESFGKNARLYTIEHFSWEKIAQKYLDVLKNL